MTRTVPQPPQDPNALFQRGMSLQRSGNLEEAIAIYRYLNANFGTNAATLLMLGIALAQKGELAEALGLFEQSIRLAPNTAEAHYNRGEVLRKLQRIQESLLSYEQAVRLKPQYALAHHARGIVLAQLGRLAEALQSFDRAIQIAPEHSEAHFNRAAVLSDLERMQEAVASYDRAIELRPDYAEAFSSRAAALVDLDRLSDALGSCNRAIELRPDHAQAHCNRGTVLRQLQRLDEALTSFDAAIRIQPSLSEAHTGRGNVLLDLGRLDDALASYDRAIQLDPDYAEALANKSTLCLLIGEMSEGWRLYEWRWKVMPAERVRNFPQPLWLGQEPIAGKTILIYWEQGLGDMIQFSRYIPLLERLGATVVFEVPRSLVSLMATLKCKCVVVEAGRQLPQFDLQCPLMSLPLAFQTNQETIPDQVPYLCCDEEKSNYWKRRLGQGKRLRVGLVWSTGHDERKKNIAEQKRRDIPLSQLESLNIEGVDFYSLQIGDAAVSQLKSLESAGWNGPRIADYTDEIKDFSDTAALTDNLDLVISVCTSVAHLAGAMGKRTWVLLQHRADWRWLPEGSRSPWYRTVTLFRQASVNDWTNVVTEVRQRLVELAGAHRSSSCC
jgi:tetratricopeptide (TPR) repeat protein